MSYNCKNYHTDGGDTLVIGGNIKFEGDGQHLFPGMPNIASGDATAAAIVTALKNAGLMVGDAFALTYSAVAEAHNANRNFNDGKISSVAIDNDAHTITITLSAKVSTLKTSDGGNGWGVHKWLGIGLVSGINYPTADLKYNGSLLTATDASEASGCGCEGTGVFVRWVAADLVLVGDNTQKSVDTFTLWASGYANTTYKLVIVEPS